MRSLRKYLLVSLTALALSSDAYPDEPIVSPTQPVAILSTTQPCPFASYAPLGNLPWLVNPPVHPKCRLWPMHSEGDPRHYIPYDLKGDGKTEYFIENWSGAHSIGFAIVDTNGKLLLRERDTDEFGGDRIVILSEKHHGYHDLVCSDTSPGIGGSTVDSRTWRFDGTHYVKAHAAHFSGEKHFIENNPQSFIAFCYIDVFSCPKVMWPKLHLAH